MFAKFLIRLWILLKTFQSLLWRQVKVKLKAGNYFYAPRLIFYKVQNTPSKCLTKIPRKNHMVESIRRELYWQDLEQHPRTRKNIIMVISRGSGKPQHTANKRSLRTYKNTRICADSWCSHNCPLRRNAFRVLKVHF